MTTPIADRIAPARSASAEMSSMNIGSMNFSFHGLADRYDSFKFDWEKEHIRTMLEERVMPGRKGRDSVAF